MKDNQPLAWPAGMEAPVNEATFDGIVEALKTFIRKNELSVTPGTIHTNPLEEFTLRLTAEFQDNDKATLYRRIYPFKASLKDVWVEMLADRSPVLVALWDNKEDKECIALARTVSYLETLKFLEDNRDDVVSEYRRIRGDDLQPDDGIMLPE